MKYIVYLTKNIINSKIYIGIHECEDPFTWDYYLGCGAYANKPSSYNKAETPFQAAILKYGPKNFRRVVLKVFDTEKEALWLEEILVDEDFIKRDNTYNITLGGGKPPRADKKTYQYDLNGNFISEFKSHTEASEKTGSYIEGIRNAITLHRSCNNFYWSHEKYDVLNITNYTITKRIFKIFAFNKDLDLIGEFKTQQEAAKFFDFAPSSISNSILRGHFCHGVLFASEKTSLEEILERQKNFNRVCKTPVFSYDINTGEFVKEYESIASACRDLNLKVQAPIIRDIKTNKTSAGLRWSYYKVDNILNEETKKEPNKPKLIGQYDLDGNLIKTWTIKDCRKEYPNCIRVCHGSRKKAYGYVFKYIYKQIS